MINDRILVEKPSYWLGGSPRRGDVVVFGDPGGWLGAGDTAGPDGAMQALMAKIGLLPAGGNLVKRVIGTGGDTITCCDKQGRVLVNGEPLDEDAYLASGAQVCADPAGKTCGWKAGPVPAGHLFVMGDNRDKSADSSAHMCASTDAECAPNSEFVDEDLVVGRAVTLMWPASRFTWLHRPQHVDEVPPPQ